MAPSKSQGVPERINGSTSSELGHRALAGEVLLELRPRDDVPPLSHVALEAGDERQPVDPA